MLPIDTSTRRSCSVASIAVLVISSLALAGSAIAEDSWGYDIAHDLMSPYCPGRTLATCPSPQAAELVQWIVMQEAAGATQDQVIEMLIERFGEDILGAPKAEGITLWAYIMPVLGFAIGGAVAFLVLRRIVGGGRSPQLEAAMPGGGSMPVPSRAIEDPATPAPVTASASTPASEDDDLARIVDSDLDLRA
jgi:cytochrome c-type biogenesis protein CcmH/NrfF